MAWACDFDARTTFGGSMQVGDLVRFRGSIGIITEVTEWATLVRWNDGVTEDVDNYAHLRLEVVSESR
jgi:hypothetical protein